MTKHVGLVLSRKRDEGITITLPDGRRILLTVLRISWDQVRIGILAPEDVAVHRDEIQARVDADQGAPR